MSRRECPSGCGRQVAPGKLLCLPCWREVPPHVQREVYRTWRAWRRSLGDAEAFAAYCEATDAAIGSIR